MSAFYYFGFLHPSPRSMTGERPVNVFIVSGHRSSVGWISRFLPLFHAILMTLFRVAVIVLWRDDFGAARRLHRPLLVGAIL